MNSKVTEPEGEEKKIEERRRDREGDRHRDREQKQKRKRKRKSTLMIEPNGSPPMPEITFH